MQWEGLYCPCCGYRVRSKPRHFKYKEKFRAHMAAVQATTSKTRDAINDIDAKLEPVVTA
jgi:hypothetical protein